MNHQSPLKTVMSSLLSRIALQMRWVLDLPNRSLWMIQGEVGSGKSLVSQRLIFGLLENGSKVLVVTTELTTRGWIEQMESIGYPVTDYIASGMLMVFSRFGVIAEAKEGVDLFDVLESDAVEKADVIVVDSASALMPESLEPHNI